MLSVGSHGATLVNREGWRQAAELGLALLLSAAIGLEREFRQKNAGLRTHTLVGVGAALFMLISKYRFTDIRQPRLALLDPSRVAAQIVTGVGFSAPGSSSCGVIRFAVSPRPPGSGSAPRSARPPEPACWFWPS